MQIPCEDATPASEPVVGILVGRMYLDMMHCQPQSQTRWPRDSHRSAPMTVKGFTRQFGVMVLGVLILLASCASSDGLPVRPPEEIWLKRGCDEVGAPHDNLDDLRDAPGGRSIADWRLQACTSFPADHVPGGFVARHVGYPDVPDQFYAATNAREERDRVVWFQYHPR